MLHIFILVVFARKIKFQKAIECTSCKQWIHIKCNGTSLDDYNRILEANYILNESEIADITWICKKCKIIENAQIFPFGHEQTHDLQDIILTDYFRCRNFRMEKPSRKVKCVKFCAFRVDKHLRMDPT